MELTDNRKNALIKSNDKAHSMLMLSSITTFVLWPIFLKSKKPKKKKCSQTQIKTNEIRFE